MGRLDPLYAAFNARDLEAVLAALTADVDWPDAWEGGRVVGRAAVRDYWTRQWAQIAPTVTPLRTTQLPDGRLAVDVAQVVRDLDGTVLREATVRHVYTFREELVARMDIEAAAD
ncbi:nuclear transport factor 2 family protein [Geodermatophilus sp. URMC 64]